MHLFLKVYNNIFSIFVTKSLNIKTSDEEIIHINISGLYY